nr:hypothetical protein [Phenylobacterium sp.]
MFTPAKRFVVFTPRTPVKSTGRAGLLLLVWLSDWWRISAPRAMATGPAGSSKGSAEMRGRTPAFRDRVPPRVQRDAAARGEPTVPALPGGDVVRRHASVAIGPRLALQVQDRERNDQVADRDLAQAAARIAEVARGVDVGAGVFDQREQVELHADRHARAVDRLHGDARARRAEVEVVGQFVGHVDHPERAAVQADRGGRRGDRRGGGRRRQRGQGRHETEDTSAPDDRG